MIFSKSVVLYIQVAIDKISYTRQLIHNRNLFFLVQEAGEPTIKVPVDSV